MENLGFQEGILSNYHGGLDNYDEMWDSNGQVRDHWQTFYQNISQMGSEELSYRHQELLRIFRENGVTYNVYNDPKGFNRPWNLDPVPFIVSEKEWQIIEQGIKQRAELLNLIVTDLYGPRKLIKEGLLPMEMVLNHSGFLRPVDKLGLPGAHQLIIYAVDLARGPDGKMWAINDRTQAPSGSGYTLENRAVMNRVLPDLFGNCQVRKLSSYFRALRSYLHDISPNQKENPRVVILTPGPRNETYFEHAYLASNLGYTLVEGGDLVVRDGYVWLKSLSGLDQVDIIIRRVDGIFCDPLELRSDSQLGVAGLLEAVRQQNVAVVNPLGSNVVENPGINAFIANIAKYYLNEELILPTIATWWCGQPKEMQYVLDNLEKLIIKIIDRQFARKTFFGSQMSKAELEELKQAIRARPNLYVGQEQVQFSTSPSFVNGKLEPRYSVMRIFSVASGQEGYTVMPGGLTRSSPYNDNFLVSNQVGGVSKDTWVLTSETNTNGFEKKQPKKTVEPHDIGVLTSRTADNLFWAGRYTQRALESSRMLRQVFQELRKSPSSMEESEKEVLQILLKALTQLTQAFPGFTEEDIEGLFDNPTPEILSITLDPLRPGSLANTIKLLSNATLATRDKWSLDTWRIFDKIDAVWNNSLDETNQLHILNMLDQLITSLMAFIGLNNETMTHEQGNLLFKIGRRIEHGQLLSTMVRFTLSYRQDEQVEAALMETVLLSNENLNTYRNRYRSYLELSSVLDLLILDNTNPRSVVKQLDKLKEYLGKLPKKHTPHHLGKSEKLILEAYTMLRLTEPENLLYLPDGYTLRASLDHTLFEVIDKLNKVSEEINQTYFNHTVAQKQLTNIDPGIEI